MADRCDVCAAPVVQVDGNCAFCHSPVSGDGDPQELLAYLAERLPSAQVRHVLFGRGAVREVSLRGKVVRYSAAMRGGRLVVEPDVALAEWVEMLLAEVSRMAVSNPDVRRGLSRSGWAFR